MATITSETHPEASPAANSWIQRHPVAAFFLIAFAGTWALTIPLALSSGGYLFAIPDIAFILLFIFSIYLGPFLGAIIVTRATEGRPGIRQLFRRVAQWRVRTRWYLAAIFSFLLVWLVAYSILLNGAPLQALLANPLLLVTIFLPWLLQGLLIPSLGEETGWRGFAFPRLQAQHGPILATLILGLLQGLWHLPILFTPLLGPFTPGKFISFILTAATAVFLYNWVFNSARGSVFIAILMHASGNAASRLMEELIPAQVVLPGPLQALYPDWFNVMIFSLVALLLVIFTRGRLGLRSDT